MRNAFLKSFSRTDTAKALVEDVLQPDLDDIKDVTKGEYGDATKGEIFMGKLIASQMIQLIIDDIQHYKEQKIKVKDPKDQMN